MDDPHLGLAAERRDLLAHRPLHDVERGAAHERRCEVDRHVVAVDVDGSDHAEIDEGDDRDLGIGDLVERRPDLVGGHHVAPGSDRRTIVISSCSSASSAS